MYNDEMAEAQRRHPGRVWATGVVPLQATKAAVDELDRMVQQLGLIGVNIPNCIGRDNHIDRDRLKVAVEIVENLGLSKDDQKKIFGLNARRFFGPPEHVRSRPKQPAFA